MSALCARIMIFLLHNALHCQVIRHSYTRSYCTLQHPWVMEHLDPGPCSYKWSRRCGIGQDRVLIHRNSQFLAYESDIKWHLTSQARSLVDRWSAQHGTWREQFHTVWTDIMHYNACSNCSNKYVAALIAHPTIASCLIHFPLRLRGLGESWPKCLGTLGWVDRNTELSQRPAKFGTFWANGNGSESEEFLAKSLRLYAKNPDLYMDCTEPYLVASFHPCRSGTPSAFRVWHLECSCQKHNSQSTYRRVSGTFSVHQGKMLFFLFCENKFSVL